jgi:GntR family transcriptional regulator of vanillate catabolism
VEERTVAKRHQTTRALAQIRELLFNGELHDWKRLSEPRLVQRVGVSRSGVRLALAVLEQEGLVDMLPTGGYVARKFSWDDVRDILELRAVLIGTAARLAATRAERSPELVSRMGTCVEGMQAELNAAGGGLPGPRYRELDREFHETLRQLARSPVLERALNALVTLPLPQAQELLAAADDTADVSLLAVEQQQHQAVLQSIEGGQAARAERVAREHERERNKRVQKALLARRAETPRHQSARA